MQVADLASSGASRFDGRGDGAGRRAPGNDEQVAGRIAFGQNIRDVLADSRDFCGANAHHVFVVQGLVVHVASAVLLFEAANAVLEPGGAGPRPGPRQGLRIALYGMKPTGSVANLTGKGGMSSALG